MFSNTLGIARKYGAKAATAAGALVVSGMAVAQDSPLVTAVKEEVSQFRTDGVAIATILVVTFFAIGLIYSLKRK